MEAQTGADVFVKNRYGKKGLLTLSSPKEI